MRTGKNKPLELLISAVVVLGLFLGVAGCTLTDDESCPPIREGYILRARAIPERVVEIYVVLEGVFVPYFSRNPAEWIVDIGNYCEGCGEVVFNSFQVTPELYAEAEIGMWVRFP